MTRGIRKGLLAAMGPLVLLSAALLWIMYGDHMANGGQGTPSNEKKYIRVARQEVTREISTVGTIAPGDTVAVVAPFDGLIKERKVNFGDLVQPGQALFVLDTTDLEKQLRDAMSAQLKARKNYDDAKAWNESTEVLRQKREVSTTAASLKVLQSRATETKHLLDEGIVARREYDDILDQVRAQRDQLESAEEGLRATEAKGNADSLTIAELEMRNAQVTVQQIEDQMAAGQIKSPVGGLILKPSDPSSTNPANPLIALAIGARASKGQHLVSVGSLQTVKVIAEFSELDIAKVKVGQRARIGSDSWGGIELQATVTSISAQAEQSALGGIPVFVVTFTLDQIPDSIRQFVRVGGSVKALVETYRNDTAVVVPADALIGSADDTRVLVVGNDGSLESRPIHVVGPTANGVEIDEGLDGSETLAITAR